MDARNNIATDLFYKIRSRFSGLKLGAETGEITINPEEARFFDFDYMEGESPIGHVSVSLAEPNSMKVYFSHGITEGMDQTQKGNWYGFLKELRLFAKRRLLSFDTRDIAKDNLDKRDYEFLSQNAQPKASPNTITTPVGESIMSESQLYGTKTVSYQKLENTRLIIKHSQALQDDTQPGARSRNISGLFVENGDGERFKYPFIHLSGARAMQRHVANGGKPYDEIGESIIRMSEEIAQLKSFGNYVVRNDLMNSDTNNVVERSTQQLNSLRETIAKLAKQGHYEAYRESFQAQSPMEVPQDVVEQFTDQFTVRNFKEDIASVFPVLYRLMQQESTIGYDDIVAMTTEESTNEDIEVSTEMDPFSKFESWVMNLGETSAIQSQDPDEQQAALQQLQELVGQHFPAGVDGANAIESLKGIIEDPKLEQAIQAQAQQDPDSCVRGLVKEWLTQNAPETLEQLDFGDFVDEPVPVDPMQYANDAADADAVAYGQQEGIEEAAEGKPAFPKHSDYGYDGVNWAAFKASPGYAEYQAATDAWLKADKAWRAQQARKYDTTVTIMNPHFDVNGPEDEEDPDYQAEEIEVGVDYSSSTHGEYRPATWGYHGGEPEEYPETEYDITKIVDIDTGRDLTKDDEVFDLVLAKLEEEQTESIEEGPNKSDIPASQRKASGDKDWKVSQKDLDKEKDSKISHPDTLRKNRGQTESSNKLNVQEVAEFINSFYDKESGTFPKGPEGVATMVGKKFGEQAEHAARKMVERMAPQQADPQIAELARIRELSGMGKSVEEASPANSMTPNWAKYVLDQIYNSNGEVTLTDLFDEGIPGLHDMFMATAQKHGLNTDDEFEEVQHELTLELEELIKGGHDVDEGKSTELDRIRQLSGM